MMSSTTGRLFDLSGKNALVTGGARGLGYSIATGLASHGANIALLDVDPTGLPPAVEGLGELGIDGLPLVGDVTVMADVESAVAAVVDRWGSLDILVNNAGIAILGPAAEMTLDDFRTVHELDLVALFGCAQAARPALAESEGSSIINIASMAGMRALRYQQHVGYNSAKAAVIMVTKTLAVEWAGDGIRVNAIAPGYMITPPIVELRKADPDRWAAWMSTVPMGRAGDPTELQGAAVYLASNASSYVTGTVLVVDGGCTC
jgi:NAD(P)-dependent dehydrogenase (short-subunit alcohol dehydrogenase family)